MTPLGTLGMSIFIMVLLLVQQVVCREHSVVKLVNLTMDNWAFEENTYTAEIEGNEDGKEMTEINSSLPLR